VSAGYPQIGRTTGDTGWLQSPAGWTSSPSTATLAPPFRISGYAIDDRAATGTGVSSVDLSYIDNGVFVPLGTALYGASHPHLVDTHGARFEPAGYELTVSMPPGTYTVRAIGRSTFDGSPTFAGSTTVTTIAPSASVGPADLQFGAAMTAGTPTRVTPAQTLALSGFGTAVAWTASSQQPWIQLSATTGTGPGHLDVIVDPALLPASGIVTGGVRINVPGVSPPIDVPVRVDVYPATATAAPFGSFDGAPSPASGAVPLTGWALDDVGVTGVAIYRSASVLEAGSSLVFIGDATFVQGARPDVASAYPQAPQKTRAGWGYMLLSNVLPGGGNETLTFYAFARDIEGRQTLLGSRSVTLTNAAVFDPFGAIDAPSPGGTASGVYTVTGWVVAPRPARIADVRVYIDGQLMGTAAYGLARPDVAAALAGPAAPVDAAAAGFRFTIDMAGFVPGLHTIAVVGEANGTGSGGIGSRYFVVRQP
jgi:hypothetical protein